jgi:hypothetical protein
MTTIVQMMARHYKAICAEFDHVEGQCWDLDKAIKASSAHEEYHNIPVDKAREMASEVGTRYLREKLANLGKARDAAEESIYSNMAVDLVDCLIQADRIAILTDQVSPQDKEGREALRSIENMSVSIAKVLVALTGANLEEFGGWGVRLEGHGLLPATQDRRAAE